MKRAFSLLIAALPLLGTPALGGNDTGAPLCYGYAIVGYDMVINARMGVPPDHAVGLAAKDPRDQGPASRYSIPLLKIILGAYLWQGGPDEYATQVMNSCMQHQAGTCSGTRKDASIATPLPLL